MTISNTTNPVDKEEEEATRVGQQQEEEEEEGKETKKAAVGEPQNEALVTNDVEEGKQPQRQAASALHYQENSTNHEDTTADDGLVGVDEFCDEYDKRVDDEYDLLKELKALQEQEKLKSGSRGETLKTIKIAVLITVLIVGAVTIITMAISRGRNNKNRNDGYFEIMEGSTFDTSSTNEDDVRYRKVMDYLMDNNIIREENLRYSNSPQTLAAKWIATLDTARIPIPETRTNDDIFGRNANVQEENNQDGYDFLQRYVMAVFYYEMNGHNGAWVNDLNFLSHQSVCHWFQLVTNENTNANNPNQQQHLPLLDDTTREETLFQTNPNAPANPSTSTSSSGGGKTEKELIEQIKRKQKYIVDGKNEPTPTGVSCDENFNINGLFMDNNNLIGTLPTELGLLSDSLTYLHLEFNEIVGNIPTTFQYLSHLEYMNIGYNALWGTIPNFIGTKLYNNLQTLLLHHNLLTGTLPIEFKNSIIMNRLLTISLDNNLLTGPISNIFNTYNYVYNTTIQNILLEDNFFKERMDSEFLIGLYNLKILDLSNNLFTGYIPEHFFDEEYSSSLEIVDLSNNDISGIYPPTKENTVLKFLALQDNSITSATNISATLQYLHSLTHLDVSSNQLTSMLSFLDSTPTSQSIEYLFLANNPTMTRGSIPTSLQFYDQLKEVSFKNTNRHGTIPDFLGSSLSKLIYLDVDHNFLTGPLPTSLGLLSNSLQYLLVNNNLLTGTLPTSTFLALSNLKLTFLDNNDITGDIDGIFCDSSNANNKKSKQQQAMANNINNMVALPYVVADCNFAETEQIHCTCCDVCCPDDINSLCNPNSVVPNLYPSWQNGYNRSFYYFSDRISFFANELN